jgi:hypothetical protein
MWTPHTRDDNPVIADALCIKDVDRALQRRDISGGFYWYSVTPGGVPTGDGVRCVPGCRNSNHRKAK